MKFVEAIQLFIAGNSKKVLRITTLRLGKDKCMERAAAFTVETRRLALQILGVQSHSTEE